MTRDLYDIDDHALRGLDNVSQVTIRTRIISSKPLFGNSEYYDQRMIEHHMFPCQKPKLIGMSRYHSSKTVSNRSIAFVFGTAQVKSESTISSLTSYLK